MDNIFDLLPFAQKLVQSIKIYESLPLFCISQERVNQLSVPTVLDEVAKYVNEVDGSKPSKVRFQGDRKTRLTKYYRFMKQ
jgi:hypothetical protein